MKTSLEIALQYIKYYKNKSISILFSIILAVALIVGLGTLFKSAQNANVEKVRKETTDYHYYLPVNQEQFKILESNNAIENTAVTKYYDSAKEPNQINIIRADVNYINLSNSKVIKGRMPTKEGEIALEEWVIRNLDIKPVVGEKVTFQLVKSKKSETFTLTGILGDFPQKKAEDVMEGYIVFKENTKNFNTYIKFNELQDIRKQFKLLLKKMNYTEDNIYVNRDLLEALNVATYIPAFGTNGSVRFIIDHYHLDMLGVIFAISLFSALVIYSVFHISTMKRISEYGLLEALGAENIQIFMVLMFELLILFLVGYPIGALTGYLGARLLNNRFASVLIGHEVNSGQIYISTKSILIGALFLLLLLIIIAICMLKKLNKLTPMEAIQQNYKQKLSKLKSKTQYSLRKGSITNVISYKNIVRKKSAFLGILLSLSLGGAIFLCATYAIDLKMENNELSIKADNDLNSDYQINIQVTDFDNGIRNSQIAEIKKISGIDLVSPISYYYGSIVLNDDKMLSKIMWDDYNNESYFKNSFGGMYSKIDDSSNNYLLRTGIYGYDDHMLNVLKDYILEGEIDIGKMKNDNLILFKQIQDGGNGLYDLIDVKPGDTITIRYQKSPKLSEKSLRFEEGPEYMEKEYIVGATLKRVAASNDYFLGDSGEDIIMTNDQFQRDFGINTYNMVSITKKEDSNHDTIANKIKEVVKDTPLSSVRDLTIEIAENNAFVNKQRSFLYGITFVLFIISLFNILNNISYNVLSRMNEFGVLRAMGITDESILGMVIREGFLYGFFASIITVFISLLGQLVVLKMVKIAYLYIDPHFTINIKAYIVITILNILVAIVATIISSRKIIKISIVEEIKKHL